MAPLPAANTERGQPVVALSVCLPHEHCLCLSNAEDDRSVGPTGNIFLCQTDIFISCQCKAVIRAGLRDVRNTACTCSVHCFHAAFVAGTHDQRINKQVMSLYRVGLISVNCLQWDSINAGSTIVLY